MGRQGAVTHLNPNTTPSVVTCLRPAHRFQYCTRGLMAWKQNDSVKCSSSYFTREKKKMKALETKGLISTHAAGRRQGRCSWRPSHAQAIKFKAGVAGSLTRGQMPEGVRVPHCGQGGGDPRALVPRMKIHRSLPSEPGPRSKRDVKCGARSR